MASVTLQMLKGYLERFGWSRYQAVDELFEQECLIRTSWRSSEADEGYTMIIDPMVERNYLSFKVVRILSAPLDSTPTRTVERPVAGDELHQLPYHSGQVRL